MTPAPQPRATIKPRRAARRAGAIWTVTVAATATSLSYTALHPLPARLASSQGSASDGVVAVVLIAGFATVGALLAWKRPANPIGWLMSGTGLAYAAGAVGITLASFPRTLALSNWSGWIWLFGLGLTVFVLLLFPTGRLPSRRWRPAAWAAAAGLAGWVLGCAFAPTLVTDSPASNPVGVRAPAGDVFTVMAFGGALLVAGAAIASLVSLGFRYRRARAVEREQLKWLVYAGALIVTAALGEVVAEKVLGPGSATNNLQNALLSGAVALVPVAIGIAIFRYHLYGIDVVINKTLVFGALAAFITGMYVAIVVGLSALARHGGRPSLALSIVATAVVAVAFQPVRERVQRLAGRLVYGRRATPYEALSEFAGRMGGTYATEDLLPRMARVLAEGTGAARADVWLRAGAVFRDDATWPPGAPPLPDTPATALGAPASVPAGRVLAVQHEGEVLGALSVTKRPGESFTPTEGRLLEDLAAQAGLVLRNVRLWEQLMARLEEIRASRQRLVAAQDEERRRIERNIHDGAQQQLVALAIKLTITEGLIGTDADAERELLGELRQEAADAVGELRDLARGIYPPLLASQGLAAALRAQAARSAVPVSVDAGDLGRYPQEVEAVVYFCVLEALQNVAKYAAASRAEVRLGASAGGLTFEVADDGAGFDPSARAFGTGLQGMADRLSALGGSLEVRSSPGAGTVVAGRLRGPVAEAA